MNNINKIPLEKRIFYLFTIIHCIISYMWSRHFFVSIYENVGSELMAYKWLSTGDTIQFDGLSRFLCKMYSHFLAIILIVLFWKWLYIIFNSLRKKKDRPYIVLFIIVTLVGVLFIILSYPMTIVSAPDTTYNYVYAKEWLPMYWHGFLTNVIHCACMLVFCHPVALSLIPFLFSISVIYYFTYYIANKINERYKLVVMLIWAVCLLLMPETVQVMTYAGRNYMYVSIVLCYYLILMKDYIEKASLTKKRFILLCIMACIVGTWRTEGIISLAAFPLLVFMVYKDNTTINIHKSIRSLLIFIIIFAIFWIPGKYGSEKYQGYDYFIINAPGPLAAVLNSNEANLEYNGFDKDYEKVISVCPEDYIKKYGEFATQFYNWDNKRLSRQSSVSDEKGKDFVEGAYSILFHNLPIYLKWQTNLYLNSIGIDSIFEFDNKETEEWILTDSELIEFNTYVMNYYFVGSTDIEQYSLTNGGLMQVISTYVKLIINNIYNIELMYGGVIKICITMVVVILTILSVIKRKLFSFIIGGLILATLVAIILTAPATRSNYYYYPYYLQYWYILFYYDLYRNTKLEKAFSLEKI